MDLGSLSKGGAAVDGGPSASDAGPTGAEGSVADANADAAREGGVDAGDPSLFLDYRFDDDIRDSSGLANDGSAITMAFVAGVHGRALYCTGSPPHRLVWGGRFSPGTSSFTIAGWFRVSATLGPNTQVLFAKGGDFDDPNQSSVGFGIGVQRDTGYVHGYVKDVGVGSPERFREVKSYAPAMFGDSYLHLALVVDRSAAKLLLYVEGGLASEIFLQGDYGSLDTPDPGTLCANDKVLNHAGAVDDFRIFRRALSPTEIATIAVR